jgi:hypothetical protein
MDTPKYEAFVSEFVCDSISNGKAHSTHVTLTDNLNLDIQALEVNIRTLYQSLLAENQTYLLGQYTRRKEDYDRILAETQGASTLLSIASKNLSDADDAVIETDKSHPLHSENNPTDPSLV